MAVPPRAARPGHGYHAGTKNTLAGERHPGGKAGSASEGFKEERALL